MALDTRPKCADCGHPCNKHTARGQCTIARYDRYGRKSGYCRCRGYVAEKRDNGTHTV